MDPELEFVSVQPELVNHRTAVVTLRNSQPVLMENVTMQANIYKENEAERVKNAEREDVQMAPNSTMDFVVDWNNEPIQAGTYHVEMTASDGENKWEWQEAFTVEEEDEALNESAVVLESSGEMSFNWYIAGIIGLAAIVVVLVLYIRRLKRGRE